MILNIFMKIIYFNLTVTLEILYNNVFINEELGLAVIKACQKK